MTTDGMSGRPVRGRATGHPVHGSRSAGFDALGRRRLDALGRAGRTPPELAPVAPGRRP
ncbi:hypothetical protein ACIQU1_06020 [Streptomyces angustmyceticus]|uniref:hypothetical protein n=1 Tax=Streptomyces angustmyceticus TaxID=285578 RepID=UPI0034504A16